MTNLLPILSGTAVFFDGYETVRSVLTFLVALGLIALCVFCIRELVKLGVTKGTEAQETLDQLRTALCETEQLAQSQLANSDHQLYEKVSALLTRAGKHLNPPISEPRLYEDIYRISWYRYGLSLVAQARQIIDIDKKIKEAQEHQVQSK